MSKNAGQILSSLNMYAVGVEVVWKTAQVFYKIINLLPVTLGIGYVLGPFFCNTSEGSDKKKDKMSESPDTFITVKVNNCLKRFITFSLTS
jgi:hypothetical protein